MANMDREQQLRQQGWIEQADVGAFVDLIGPLWTRRHNDQVEYGMQIEAKHLNTNGIVHGGLLMTFIDQVFSHTIWDAGDKTPKATIDMSTHFMDAVREGDWLVARASVQRRTRSLAFVTGELVVGDRIALGAQAIMKFMMKA